MILGTPLSIEELDFISSPVQRQKTSGLKKNLPKMLSETAWSSTEPAIFEWKERSIINTLKSSNIIWTYAKQELKSLPLDLSVITHLARLPLDCVLAWRRELMDNWGNCSEAEAREITSHIFIPGYEWEVSRIIREDGISCIRINGRMRSRMAA